MDDLNEGYVVRVHFGREDYSATDAWKQYLRQIAEAHCEKEDGKERQESQK